MNENGKMRALPDFDVYNQEFKYFPWGKLIERVIGEIVINAPQKARVLDLMCGTGYLLNVLKNKRPDLILEGVDIDEIAIKKARDFYPSINFFIGDVLEVKTENKYDVVVCTGGIHHLPYKKQPKLIEIASKILFDSGFAIFAEPTIEDYISKKTRKLGVLELGYRYTKFAIEKEAPDEIIRASLDILFNDIFKYEFKTSIDKLLIRLQKNFNDIYTHLVWPSRVWWGDCYFICKQPYH